MRYDFCSVIIKLGVEVSSNFIEKLRMNKLRIFFFFKNKIQDNLIYDNAQSQLI